MFALALSAINWPSRTFKPTVWSRFGLVASKFAYFSSPSPLTFAEKFASGATAKTSFTFEIKPKSSFLIELCVKFREVAKFVITFLLFVVNSFGRTTAKDSPSAII